MAAAVYYDDMYVDRELSMRTARAIRGLQTWVTSEYEHNGLRPSGGAVLGRLIGDGPREHLTVFCRGPGVPRRAPRDGLGWGSCVASRAGSPGRGSSWRSRPRSPSWQGQAAPPSPSADPDSSHVAAMSRGGLTRAELKVTSGTAILDVSVGRLGGTLLRVSTPDGAPVRPVLSDSGLVVLSLDGTAPGGPADPQRPGFRLRGDGGAQRGRHVEPGPGRRHPAHQGRPARRQGGRDRRHGGLRHPGHEPAPAGRDAAPAAGRRGEPVPAQPARPACRPR